MRSGYIYKTVVRRPQCQRCDYCLEGLSEGPCPECGTPFDLRERSALDVPALVPTAWAFWILPLATPWVAFAAGGALWLFARFALGRWPTLNIGDGPEGVLSAPVVEFASQLIVAGMSVPMISLVPACILLWWTRRTRQKRTFWVLVATPAWLIAGPAALVLAPWNRWLLA